MIWIFIAIIFVALTIALVGDSIVTKLHEINETLKENKQ